MFVCVDGNLVGEKSSDQLPSPCKLALPRSEPESELRSPKIHTSTESIPPGPADGSDALPVMVNVALPLALTFWFSVGAVTVPVGAPPPPPVAAAGAPPDGA